MSGTVTFSMSNRLTDVSELLTIVPVPLTADLDPDGHFSVQIPATNDPDISPTGFVYTVKETLTGYSNTYQISVPYDTVGSIDLSVVSPVTSPPEVSSYASQAALDAETSARVDAVANLQDEIDALGTPGTARKYAATIGDGTTKNINVAHSLGTQDVLVQVYQASDGTQVWVDNRRLDTNTIQLQFGAAPALNAYRVVVVA